MRLLPQQVTAAAIRVVKANAFRAIQHKDRTPMDMLDGDDDEPYLEPARAFKRLSHLKPLLPRRGHTWNSSMSCS